MSAATNRPGATNPALPHVGTPRRAVLLQEREWPAGLLVIGGALAVSALGVALALTAMKR